MLKPFAISLLTLLFVSSCREAKEEEGEFEDSGPQLLEEFKQRRGEADDITEANLGARISSFAHLFKSPDESEYETDSESSETNRCQDEEARPDTVYEVMGKMLRAQLEHSTSEECAEEFKNNAKQVALKNGFARATITKSFQAKFLINCKNDVSDSQATLEDEIEALIEKCEVTEASLFSSNFDEYYDYNAANGEINESTSNSEGYLSLSDAAGHPCSSTTEVATCSMGILAKTSGDNASFDHIFLTPNNLTLGSTPGLWYESGTWDLTLNNWEGVVTAQGEAVEPVYVMSNGNNEISGSIQEFITLMNRSQSPMLRMGKSFSKAVRLKP